MAGHGGSEGEEGPGGVGTQELGTGFSDFLQPELLSDKTQVNPHI